MGITDIFESACEEIGLEMQMDEIEVSDGWSLRLLGCRQVSIRNCTGCTSLNYYTPQFLL